MFKQWLLAGTLAASVVAAGCGGGSSDSSGSGSSSGSNPGAAVTVSGPLDGVQTTVSNDALGLLEQASAGTPLQGVLVCTDDLANHNTLDILDSLLNAAQNPSSASSTTPAQVQALLKEMASNLTGLLNALAGKGGCGQANTAPVTNPLAGTPLAPLGDALLPVLQKIQAQLASGSTSGNGLDSLASLVAQLNTAFQTGLAQVPSSASSQPVVGGVLLTLKDALNNLSSLTSAFASNNTSGFQSATQSLLDKLLVDLLTQVVPVTTIENKAGKPGAISGPISTAAATFASNVANALTQGEAALQSALSNSQLAPVMDLVNKLLPAILDPITKALAGAGSGSSSGSGPTGTPLDAVLAALQSVLGAITGASGGSCALANIPVLSTLCKLLP
jgi:hypothetical protein